jgi:hypothetical protein
VPCGSGDLPASASRQAEKTTASQHQARQTRAYDGTWCGVDNARCGGIEPYVGNEGDSGTIRADEVTNRCICNGKGDTADLVTLTAAVTAIYPETEIPELRLAIHTKRPGNRGQAYTSITYVGYVSDVAHGNASPIEC